MVDGKQHELIDRELSWLSFNGRVLQEAKDPRVPLYERIKFLAIFSANLDEFFRVRVASLRSLLRLNERAADRLGIHPRDLLRQINETVSEQQEIFGATFRKEIVPDLADRGVYLIDSEDLTEAHKTFVRSYYEDHLRPHVNPVVIGDEGAPFLVDRRIYLAVELYPKGHAMDVSPPSVGIVSVPSPPLDRFVRLPDDGGRRYVMFVDDVLRCNLTEAFPEFDLGGAYALKLSRDAELYLEDEYPGSIAEQIRESLARRERGMPCRFLYDLHAPYPLVTRLKDAFELDDEALVAGGRYHNLHDLASFPRFDLDDVRYEPMPPLDHPRLEDAVSILSAVRDRDHVIHPPYQKFDYVVRFLKEAADDPDVESIWATLYRTASDSAVVRQLIRAARSGKHVTAFVELKARFDEASNLEWADAMDAVGVRTIYSFRDLKVHAKLILVGRRETPSARWYAYLGTGNLNEQTARVYADHGLFTADARITKDVRRVFAFLTGEEEDPTFEHLLVAPFNLRTGFYDLIEREMESAARGRRAYILGKMNALEDEETIRKLYEASRRGVDIDLIVRGICCLVPGVSDLSSRIRVRSIVDRFLEHARVYVFHAEGREDMYLASADWMTRNLSKRVEVAFPVFDPEIRSEINTILDLQMRDNVKARIIDRNQVNAYEGGGDGNVRSQFQTYAWLRNARDEARKGRTIERPSEAGVAK